MSRRPCLLFDPEALVDNYRYLDQLGGGETGAVVKANAYGLGVDWVVPTLVEAGCSTFFVAYPDEGAMVRRLAPGATIYVFHGVSAETLPQCHASRLRPCVNTVEGLDLVAHQGLEPALHLDTGMHRLGLEPSQVTVADLESCAPSLIMSHLVSSDQPQSPDNPSQLAALIDWCAEHAPGVPRSLANTGGLLLGEHYHLELSRPGIGLYGGSPDPALHWPSRSVVCWRAPILQLQIVRKGESVGYGSTWIADRDRVIATCASGYADGLLRTLGNAWVGRFGSIHCPLVGRISMDLIGVDVTAVVDAGLPIQASDWLELLNHEVGIDAMASHANTVSYECLTRLGSRFDRHVVAWNASKSVVAQ